MWDSRERAGPSGRVPRSVQFSTHLWAPPQTLKNSCLFKISRPGVTVFPQRSHVCLEAAPTPPQGICARETAAAATEPPDGGVGAGRSSLLFPGFSRPFPDADCGRWKRETWTISNQGNVSSISIHHGQPRGAPCLLRSILTISGF